MIPFWFILWGWYQSSKYETTFTPPSSQPPSSLQPEQLGRVCSQPFAPPTIQLWVMLSNWSFDSVCLPGLSHIPLYNLCKNVWVYINNPIMLWTPPTSLIYVVLWFNGNFDKLNLPSEDSHNPRDQLIKEEHISEFQVCLQYFNCTHKISFWFFPQNKLLGEKAYWLSSKSLNYMFNFCAWLSLVILKLLK